MTRTPTLTVRHAPLMGRGAPRTTVRILTHIRIPTRTVGDTIRLRYISISDSIDLDLGFVVDTVASGARG